jgi:hypothetical protein
MLFCLLPPFIDQARQVLRWRLEKPDIAEKVWDTLAGANTEIFDTLEEMNGQYRVSAVCTPPLCMLYLLLSRSRGW